MKNFHGHKKHFPSRHHFKPRSASSAATVEGRLEIKGVVGFVISEEPGVADVLVRGPSLRLAMNDDRVRVRVNSRLDGGRRIGEITGVIKRARQRLVGSFAEIRGVPYLELDNGGPPLRLVNLKGLHPREGDLAVAKVTIWPNGKTGPSGVLEEVLGPRTGAGVDLKALKFKLDLPGEFSTSVEEEAESFGAEVPPEALAGRKTLFEKTIFTIDGADAKDFDDAVSVEKLPGGGWRLGVHIADVAHYVRAMSLLDAEAYARGTSVYLSGTVIPMLPFPLSDNLCSLRPEVVRLTLSCEMDINPAGEVISHRIFESAIKSAKRFTYEEVEAILRGENSSEVPLETNAVVREMGGLARLLRQKRFGRGSLDFDFPESDVITDPHGRPIDIRQRERLESHRLIEDFMLLANETVASHMRNSPFIYRIHEKPDPAKLAALRVVLSAAGIPIPQGFDGGKPAALQQVLAFSQGKPVQPMVQMMILRSLKQAVYSEKNQGHYGLASECYTHFTSPIRRYPDLIVHRILKDMLHNRLHRHGTGSPGTSFEHSKLVPGEPVPFVWAQKLPQIAAHSSARERAAVAAEREYLDIQRVRLMEKEVGQTFTGVISGITHFGLFVVLNNPFVEGLVHVTNLKDDYYFFDEARVTLRGKRTGKIFQIGQPVKILLAAANIIKRQLDFELLTDAARPARPPHRARAPHSRKSFRRRR